MKTFVLRLTPGTLAANDETLNTTEKQIVELHRHGFGRRTIMAALNVGESPVRRLTKDIPVDQPFAIAPFDRAVKKVYPMATGGTGIKDFEVREILYRTYGREWNPVTGKYRGLYDDDTRDRLKAKVRTLANTQDQSAIFVMDWFDPSRPAESNIFIRQCAINLRARLEDAVDDFMREMGVQLKPVEGTPTEYEAERHAIELTKQRKAARQMILQLAITGYGREPLSQLLERTEQQANSLMGTPDEPVARVPPRKPEYHPKPTGDNVFLDYVEGKGWLSPDYHAEVEDSIAQMGY